LHWRIFARLKGQSIVIAFDKNHIPYLTVIIDPTGSNPVVLTVGSDWLKTGEYILSVTPIEALKMANQAMQFAANSMADELWEQLETRKRLGEHFGDEESINR
jgi:hypothetical protein